NVSIIRLALSNKGRLGPSSSPPPVPLLAVGHALGWFCLTSLSTGGPGFVQVSYLSVFGRAVSPIICNPAVRPDAEKPREERGRRANQVRRSMSPIIILL